MNDHNSQAIDMAAHRAAWSGFLTFIQYGGMLVGLLTTHVILTAALGTDWIVSLIAVALVGAIAKPVMKLDTTFFFYLAGLCMTILLAHVFIGMAGMILA